MKPEKKVGSKSAVAVAESPYVDTLIFQQAVCSECEKMIVIQEMRFFTEMQMLETFAMDAHNALVRGAGLLCLNPQLTIFYGHARMLASKLSDETQSESVLIH